jgi:predicted nucleic acid-binding protein
MKIYWDSSALVEAVLNKEIRDRLRQDDACTRLHSLSEIFSTLTGGRLGFRVNPADAAELVEDLCQDMDVVRLDSDAVRAALGNARRMGVRGGRVHDYLHAVAAIRKSCASIRTLNPRDFDGLCEGMEIVSP